MSTEQKQTNESAKQTPATAHELVMNHINNPDQPITSEDIKNIDTNLADKPEQLTTKEKHDADELADDIKKDGTGMSYKADL